MTFLKKITLCILSLAMTFSFAEAKAKKHKPTHNPVTHVKAPIQTTVIADAKTGAVLYSEHANQTVYPASLTKMMTLYITFEELRDKHITMQTMIPVSQRAQKARPGKLFLKAGEKIAMGDAVMGLIVKSANDAAVAVAEKIGGSEDQFAHRMNAKAKALGLHGTHFTNASGWHDKHQVTTPVDMAKLGLALKRDFPEYYPLFKKTSMVFKGKVIPGHNRVLKQYAGAEGLKTGFTCPAGFNLVTTASKHGVSLIGVVMGSPTAKARDQKMIHLLDKYFVAEGVSYASLESAPKAKKTIGKHKKSNNIKMASSGGKKHKKRVKTRA